MNDPPPPLKTRVSSYKVEEDINMRIKAIKTRKNTCAKLDAQIV